MRYTMLKAIQTLLLTIKQGKDYNTTVKSAELFDRDYLKHTEQTPDVIIQGLDEDVLIIDSENNYDRNIWPIRIQASVQTGTDGALEKLYDLVADILKVLSLDAVFAGTSIHANCLRFRRTGIGGVYYNETNRLAGLDLHYEIIFYEAH